MCVVSDRAINTRDLSNKTRASKFTCLKFTLKDRMGTVPNMSIKRPITIGTMIKIDGDSDRDGGGDGTCEQPFSSGW